MIWFLLFLAVGLLIYGMAHTYDEDDYYRDMMNRHFDKRK